MAFIVAESDLGASAGGPRRRPVLVAIDLGDGSESLILAAKEMSAGGPLLLVHVVRDLSDVFRPYLCSVPLDKLQSEINLEGKTWLGRLRRDYLADLQDAREMVLEGTPWAKLVETARRNDAELIVIGASSPRDAEWTASAEGYELGSTASRVLRHAPCSVMVVPTSGR